MKPLRNIASFTTSLCLSLALIAASGCGITAISQQREANAQAQAAMQRYEKQMGLLDEVQRLQRVGRFEEARQRAEELQQSMPVPMDDTTDALDSLTDAVDMQQQMAQSAESFIREPLFVRPIMIWPVYNANDRDRLPPDAAKQLQEALQQIAMRDFDKASQNLRRALTHVRELRGPAHPYTTTILEAMGDLEHARGDVAAALRHYQEAAAVASDAKSQARILWRHASIYSTRGEPARALEASERAMRLVAGAGESTEEYAVALNNLGAALHMVGKTNEARQAYEKSLSNLAPRAVNDITKMSISDWQAQGVKSNLGLAHWRLGAPAKALDYFRQVLDQRAELDRYDDAYLTERAALAKLTTVSVELNSLLTLERTLGARASQGDAIGLQTLFDRKGALLDRQVRGMASFRKQAQKAPASSGGSSLLGKFFGFGALEDAQRKNQARRQDEDHDLMEQYQAALAERSALAQRIPSTEAGRAEQARAVADLDLRLQVMQQNMQQRPQENFAAERMPDTAQTLKDGPEEFMDKMEQQEQARRQRERDERLALLQQIQARLPPGAALLEMVRYQPLDPRAELPEQRRWLPARYGAYVINRAGAPTYVDFGEAEPIDAMVKAFRKALALPRGARAQELGRQLDDRLMRHARGAIGDATLLLVAPEGMLNLIPFGALIDEQNRYLVEHFTFNYLASGRDLLRLTTSDAPRNPPLIIANPAFGGVQPSSPSPASTSGDRSRDFSGVNFEALPGTAAEATALKTILTNAVVLSGEQATETAAKQAKGPRILHIATHGFFLEDQHADPQSSAKSAPLAENPMLRSGLAFAGVNSLRSGNDDGVLTALEAAGLDLVGAKLVVLSACETGLGEVKNGEGIFGLRRAFVVAGAETLVMSLWQVDDDATKELMVGFYSRLAAGEGRAQALRQAQLGMLRSAQYSHPFYWASFISSGESGSLK